MSQRRLPPPDPPVCLLRLRPSTQKGGTLIAEAVTERAEHERRICDPDGYRPAFCLNCNGTVLHVHDYRERKLRAEPGRPVATIVRHLCVACTAVWQTLPAFVARHLWRSWAVVERTVADTVAAPAAPEAAAFLWPRVPEGTVRRWRSRLYAAARYLVQVLAASGEQAWAQLAREIGYEATRAELVAAYARATSTPAGMGLAAVSALVTGSSRKSVSCNRRPRPTAWGDSEGGGNDPTKNGPWLPVGHGPWSTTTSERLRFGGSLSWVR